MTYVPPATAITTATIVSYTRVAGYVVPRSISGLVPLRDPRAEFPERSRPRPARGFRSRVSLFLPHTATILGPG